MLNQNLNKGTSSIIAIGIMLLSLLSGAYSLRARLYETEIKEIEIPEKKITITITSPIKDSKLFIGETYKIQWAPFNAEEKVNISLISEDTINKIWRKEQVSNTGSYNFIVPDIYSKGYQDIFPSPKFQIYISSENNSGYSDEFLIYSMKYTNNDYKFEIGRVIPEILILNNPLIHDWAKEGKHPNMGRRIWDASFSDENRYYGWNESRNTGGMILSITVNECSPGENIENCLAQITSPCGTVPYGKIKETYTHDKYGENAGEFSIEALNFKDGYPALKVEVFCINRGDRGIAVLKDDLIYNVMFLSRYEQYKDYTKILPLTDNMIESLLSTFKFID